MIYFGVLSQLGVPFSTFEDYFDKSSEAREYLSGICVMGAIFGKMIGRGLSLGNDYSYSLIAISYSTYF
jgi:hypothetical protein